MATRMATSVYSNAAKRFRPLACKMEYQELFCEEILEWSAEDDFHCDSDTDLLLAAVACQSGSRARMAQAILSK